MSTPIAAWTPVIVKGAVYQKTITVTDEAGNPILLMSAEIDVEPLGATPFAWTQGNGKFVNAGVGIYNLNLTASDTAAFTWSTGTYRLNVVDGSGDANPCLIEGRIFAKDC
jgi:hypothetical protein